MAALSPLQIEKFTALFFVYDVNKSGFLTQEDFYYFADSMGEALEWRKLGQAEYVRRMQALQRNRQQAFKRMLDSCDGNADGTQDGRISLAEFLEFFRQQREQCLQLGSLSAALKQNVREIFNLIDEDASGTISLSEFGKALRLINPAASAERVFAMLDLNGDGRLTLTELEKFTFDYVCSDAPEAAANQLFSGV